MTSSYIIENLKEREWSTDDDINFIKKTKIPTGLIVNGVKQFKEVTLKLEILEGECDDVVIPGYTLQDNDNQYVSNCEFFLNDEDLVKSVNDL